jgi:hypothetical protein
LKRSALGPELTSKGARGFGNLFRDFRMQNVAILRQARHYAQQFKRGATDHNGVELKSFLG